MCGQSEENRSINREKYEKWIGFIFLAAAAGMLILSVRLCFADGIWYDELFTMGLTGKSFGEAKALTARDVHPPFYYYYTHRTLLLSRVNPFSQTKPCTPHSLSSLLLSLQSGKTSSTKA